MTTKAKKAPARARQAACYFVQFTSRQTGFTFLAGAESRRQAVTYAKRFQAMAGGRAAVKAVMG